MPDNVMQVDIVSPERILFSGQATMVITRTLDGEIAFQPNHAPFLAALTENHTRIYEEGGNVLHVAVHGGFVEVSNNKVSVLSDVAELADQIDVNRAQAARERAEEVLRREETDEATAALRRAEARLAAAGRS
jgi:F-type H+-transporting ATPase subunit epsilon